MMQILLLVFFNNTIIMHPQTLWKPKATSEGPSYLTDVNYSIKHLVSNPANYMFSGSLLLFCFSIPVCAIQGTLLYIFFR